MRNKFSDRLLSEFVRKAEALPSFYVPRMSKTGCLLRYSEVGPKNWFVKTEVIERIQHCGFIVSCFLSSGPDEVEGLLAINLPEEVRAEGSGGFDIGLLFGSNGHGWSVLNDSLNVVNDGVFSGGMR